MWESEGIWSNMMKGGGGEGMEIWGGESVGERSEVVLRGRGGIG